MDKKSILAHLKAKGTKREMSDTERDVKTGLMKDLKKMAAGHMAGELRGLKKVTVAAQDKEGLKAGLEKAEEVVDGVEPKGVLEGQLAEVEAEAETDEDEDKEECSEEELDAEIAALMAKKEALKAKA